MKQNEKIKLGFVGLGFVCQQCHLPTFSINPNFKIEAISDPFDDLRETIGEKYGIKDRYSSHLEMLKKANIDAVIITLPRKLTFKVIKDCLIQNKWVFTEKPLCLNVTHAEEILDLSYKKDRSVYVGYMKNSDSGTELFKKEFHSKSLNSLKSIRAYCHSGYSYASPFGDIKGKKLTPLKYIEEDLPKWLDQKLEYSYEQYLNTFSHITHLLEFITEEKLYFNNYNGNCDGEGFLNASLSGIDAPIIIQTSRGKQNDWIEGIEVVYSDSIFNISYPAAFLRNVPAKITKISGRDYSSKEIIRPQWAWSFNNQTNSFYKMIIENKNKRKNLISAVNQVRLINDLYKSLKV